MEKNLSVKEQWKYVESRIKELKESGFVPTNFNIESDYMSLYNISGETIHKKLESQVASITFYNDGPFNES